MTERAAPGAVDYTLLFVLAAMWGGSFMLIKIAIVDLPPATMAIARLLIAAAIMFVVARFYGERIRYRFRVAALLVLIGLFGNGLPFTLIAWGEETVDASLAAVLMGLMPIATLVMAHFWSAGEPLTMPKLVGVGLGLVGLIVLVGPSVLLRLGDDGIRQLAILAAALSYAINAILTKMLLDQPLRAAAAWLLLAGAVVMMPVALLFEQPFATVPGPAATVAVVLLAVFPTALAALLVFKVLGRQGAGFFGQVNLLVPPLGIFWAALVLGERPGPATYLALALILAGIWVARMGQGAPSPHLPASPHRD